MIKKQRARRERKKKSLFFHRGNTNGVVVAKDERPSKQKGRQDRRDLIHMPPVRAQPTLVHQRNPQNGTTSRERAANVRRSRHKLMKTQQAGWSVRVDTIQSGRRPRPAQGAMARARGGGGCRPTGGVHGTASCPAPIYIKPCPLVLSPQHCNCVGRNGTTQRRGTQHEGGLSLAAARKGAHEGDERGLTNIGRGPTVSVCPQELPHSTPLLV